MTKAGKSRKLAKPAAMGRPAAVANAEQEILIKLEFICTDTGQTSKYEVPADVDALKDLWSRTLSVTCPQCRRIHPVPFRAAYIRAAIDAAAPSWLEEL